MRLAAVVCARMESTRLPGKSLLPLAGEPIIQIILRRAGWLFSVRDVVLACPDTVQNRSLGEFADKVYYGHPTDVLGRMIVAAERYNATDIIRLTGDNPVIDPEIAMVTLCEYLNGYDYAVIEGLPQGTQIEIMSLKALKFFHQRLKEPYYHEHPTQCFYHYDGFDTAIIPCPEKWKKPYRFTIDEQSDYEMLYNVFERHGSGVSIDEAIRYLDDHPDVAEINSHIRQAAAIGEPCPIPPD